MYISILAIKNYWTKPTTPDFVRGFFDQKHYEKVIQAKINLLKTTKNDKL